MKKENKSQNYKLNKEFPSAIIPNGTILVIYRENLSLKKKIKDLSEELRELKEMMKSFQEK